MREFLTKLVTVGIILLVGLSNASAQETVHLGAIVPLSGEVSAIGNAVRNGMLMAKDDLPKAIQEKLVLHFEDDACKPINTVSAFRKLVNIQGVNLVVSLTSGASRPIGPLAETQKIPLLAMASDENIVMGRKYPMNFWVTPQMENRIFVPEIVKRGFKKVARIYTTQSGVEAFVREFDKQNAGQVEILLDEEYPVEIKDFKPFINKLSAHSEVEAVMIFLMPGQLGLFAKQARASGVKLPFFGGEFFSDANEVKIANGALNGTWYVDSGEPNSDFLERYKKRFPGASNYPAANGYDIVKLVGKAMEMGLSSREELNNFFHTFKDFTGMLGTYSATDDNRFTLPAAIKSVP